MVNSVQLCGTLDIFTQIIPFKQISFLFLSKICPRPSAYLHIMANLVFRTVFSDAELLEAKHKLIIRADVSAFYFTLADGSLHSC